MALYALVTALTPLYALVTVLTALYALYAPVVILTLRALYALVTVRPLALVTDNGLVVHFFLQKLAGLPNRQEDVHYVLNIHCVDSWFFKKIIFWGISSFFYKRQKGKKIIKPNFPPP